MAELIAYRIYANGTFCGIYEGATPDDAMQACADDVGTMDVGETRASIDGMTAVELAGEG